MKYLFIITTALASNFNVEAGVPLEEAYAEILKEYLLRNRINVAKILLSKTDYTYTPILTSNIE